MRILRALLKPLSFLPALLMMYMIFSFSSQDGATSAELSYKVSYKIVETGASLLGEHLEPWEVEAFANHFHGIVRKLAHMTEYFALAVSVAFPLYVYGLRGFLLMLVAGFICVAFACTDEYHQSFVAGRAPSKRDVLIDSFGVFWGIVLVRIIGWTGRKTIFRPLARKRRSGKKTGTAGTDSAYSGYGNAGQRGPQYRNAPQRPYDPQFQSTPQRLYDPHFQNAPQGTYGPQFQGAPQQPYDPQFQGAPHSQYGPQYQNRSQQQVSRYGEDWEEDDADSYVSDQLSEDMSLRKLVHDLKGQKKEIRSSEKHT